MIHGGKEVNIDNYLSKFEKIQCKEANLYIYRQIYIYFLHILFIYFVN